MYQVEVKRVSSWEFQSIDLEHFENQFLEFTEVNILLNVFWNRNVEILVHTAYSSLTPTMYVCNYKWCNWLCVVVSYSPGKYILMWGEPATGPELVLSVMEYFPANLIVNETFTSSCPANGRGSTTWETSVDVATCLTQQVNASEGFSLYKFPNLFLNYKIYSTNEHIYNL